MKTPALSKLLTLALLGLTSLPLQAATVSWVGGSGDWNTAANWSTGALPSTNDDVVIDRPGEITVTHSSGTHTVKSLLSQEAFQLSGGSLTVSNTVQVNSTFTLSAGALIRATVLQGTNGQGVTVISGTLDGVTVNGDLDVGNAYNSARVTVLNGLVLNGTLYLGHPSSQSWGSVAFAGSQTLSGNGTVVFGNQANSYNTLRLLDGGTTLTLGLGITVRGQNGTIGYHSAFGGPANVGVVNQGTIAADVNGGTISVEAQPFTNQGLAQSFNGGTLILSGSWSNSGTLVVSNGTLNLSGSFTTAGLGAINRSNGTVMVSGTLENTGSTLALDAAAGSWVMNGGTLRGGVFNLSGGAQLIFGSGTLDGVTVNGDLDVGRANNNARVTVLNGLVLNGTIYLGNPGNQSIGSLYFTGSQTLSGHGTVVFGNTSCNAMRLVNASTALTIGPGITVRGHSGAMGYAGCHGGPASVGLINQGTIAADVSGGTIALNAQPFANSGVMRATGGGAIDLSGNFTTAGLGVFQSAGGVVRLTGLLDNSGAALVLDGPGDVLTLQGGTIRGGTLNLITPAQLVFAFGTLDGVTVNGDLDVGKSNDHASVTVLNGLVLNGTLYLGHPSNQSLGSVYFTGSQTLSGTGTVILGNACNALRLVNAGTTLTIGPGITVRGHTGALGYASCHGGSTSVDLINQGTIAADVSGGTISIGGQSLSNSGNVQVSAGATIDANVAFTLNGSAQLSSQPGGTLKLTGNLLGNTASAFLFTPDGTTVFNGFGTPLTPQLLEAMSRDVGIGPAGFANNFVYGTLSLANNTFVKLVDSADNSPGPEAEALYVNSLIVPAGTTLDLSGLHLYTRAAQISGATVNGSVSQIPDSGPIVLGRSTSGAIAVPGELDEWTFFGRAGQNVTIAVDTGSGAVLTPKLDYAEVRLLDPSANLVVRGSNNVARQTVVLADVPLMADGTYRIQVRAPANQPASTGNYLVSIWEVTPDVTPLVLNQTFNGRIETPYSVDRWTFSAAASQQVRFDFINASVPGVAFDLRGPNDWIGFSNLVDDSGLVNLPESGGYTLTARGTGGAYDIAYAFKLLETTQTELPLGMDFAGQFSGPAQAQIFKINITSTGPLRITLQNSGAGNRTELYAGRGTLPTRGGFEFSAASGPGASRELIIPSASVGTWYVLVYGDHIPTPGAFTIRATAAGVFLSDVLPKRQGNHVPLTMTLTGVGFEAGTTVELLGGATIAASNVSVDSFTQLTATFPPSSAPPGLYSVRIQQPDGDSATLPNAFEMLSPGEPRLETRLILPSVFGRHQVATIYVEYANTGTAAMPAPLLVLKSNDPDDSDRPLLTLDRSRVLQGYWSAVAVLAPEAFILASGAQPGVLNPGERIQVPVYFLGLPQPWDSSDNAVEMEIRYWLADDPSPIDWAARKEALRPPTLDAATWDVVYANLTTELATTGDYIRMLNDNAQYLGRLGQRVVDVNNLWNFEVQQAYGYSAIAVLESAVDSSVPAPGLALDFARHFSSNLRARNSTGWFGHGWYTPWQAALVVESGGDLVKLLGEAGSARLFTRDTRNGGYFSGAGDSSALSAVGGFYELRAPNGVVTRFRADGRMDYVQDPNGNRVTAAYDGTGRLAQLAHTSGAFIAMAYNGAGLVQRVTNSAGRSVTFTYGLSGPYLQTATSDDGKVTSYTYETAGTHAQRHALTSVTSGGTTRHFTFDTRGRLDTTYAAAGEELIQFGYDSAGGVTSTDAQGTTRLCFDHRGLLAKVTDPLGHITTSEFNDDLRLSRSVAPSGESQSFTWCGCGSPTSLTDELGHTTRFSYDHPFKRRTSFTDARGHTTRYTYDAQGNQLSTIYPNSSVERLANYTASGLAQSATNRRNQPISYTYTPSGQVDRRTFADGSFADFDYDARGNLTNVTEHPVSGPDKTTTYTYDYAADGDRLRRVTYPNARWVEYFYDSFGRRQRMTDSAGGDTRYEYDPAGRLSKLRDAANAVLIEYLYSASGGLRRINKGNGTYTTYDYDAAGQLLHLTNSAPGGSVNSRFDYTYDSRGRRRTMQTLDGNWNYDYDGSGQLIHAVFASSNPAIPSQDLQYNYDPLGNRTSTVVNGVTTDYLANSLNQYTTVGGIAFQYDADGNLTSDGLHNYVYNTQNRLVHVSGPEGATDYEYDAQGNRTATVFNGQRTEWLMDQDGRADVLAEQDGVGNVLARNVFGLGLVASAPTGGLLTYFDFDALGSTVGITANNAALSNRYAYLPFGGRLLPLESFANQFEFVGRSGVMEDATGLDYMRWRFYASNLGRFTSPDPIGFSGGDANFYRYVHNNPITRIDPEGLDDFPWETGEDDPSGWSWEPESGPLPPGYLPPPGYNCSTYWPRNDRIESMNCFPPQRSRCPRGFDCTPRSPCPLGWTFNNFRPSQPGNYSCYPPPPPPAPPPGPGGPSAPGGPGSSETRQAGDPNQKLGPNGVGAGKHVLSGAALSYRIDFENEASASAPAQEVIITDQLNPNLDLATFQLTDLGFGDQMIFVPPNRQHFETTVVMACCGEYFQVQVEAGLRLDSGQVYATFRSIDPATSLPPEVQYGFLPPEDGTGRGQGHVSYLIHARTNLPTGTQIRNVALIEFDRQASIATDQVDPHNPGAGIDANKQALNTIDAGAPTSSVTALPAESGRTFVLQWSGQDDAGGSGTANYDIYVSTNGNPSGLWIAGPHASSAPFVGGLGQTYAFYSVARDGVGHKEPPPTASDAHTMVVADAPVLVGVSNISILPGQPLNITNLVQGTPVGSFVFTLGSGTPPGVTINPTNGVLRWTPDCANSSTTNLLTVWVTDSGRTNIADAVNFTVRVRECVRPSLGQQILLAGTSGRVPINLVSSVALTNLEMTLVTAPGRLTDFAIESLVPELCTNTVVPLGEGQYRLELVACPGTFLSGTQQVAWLHFAAVTNQSSAFVGLAFTDLAGHQADGNSVANFAPQAGRVVVIGEEPLLECVRATNGQPALILYGKLAAGYAVESATNLTVSAWQPVLTDLTLTNLWRELTLPPSPSRANYFRALRSQTPAPARHGRATELHAPHRRLQSGSPHHAP
jgi:RHS repeat-associated protein